MKAITSLMAGGVLVAAFLLPLVTASGRRAVANLSKIWKEAEPEVEEIAVEEYEEA